MKLVILPETVDSALLQEGNVSTVENKYEFDRLTTISVLPSEELSFLSNDSQLPAKTVDDSSTIATISIYGILRKRMIKIFKRAKGQLKLQRPSLNFLVLLLQKMLRTNCITRLD